ncbi:Regulator of RNase E activity RraA [Pedobacter westerhofensis]|uniref:Regulator of RNase E activity RraA n=1 Tax=Pedobacter westerhofensis TaxID=425512 RepID=A0A521BAR0_9SPHI|nr:RraA family protein [Pedobacter westerhofensis]SMO44194.1 Regulator of RNase E activity RraA [Pedobacter westerhofensis]
MKLNIKSSLLALGITFLASAVNAQTIPKEELIYLTSDWKGERFPDGRPRIPDELLERAKNVGIEEAWTILNNEGYKCQFDGGFKMVHDDQPFVGRALTAAYMPSRPDLEKNIKDRGTKQGRKGNTNAWAIDMLTKGDVYVADGFGKIAEGTLIGDNLGNSIFAKTGTGVVFNASSRDLDGLRQIKGFNAFVRDWDPSYLKDVVLTGLNTPIRIGRAIVLPGDLVIAKSEGVIFIPAHLAEKVILTAEFISLRDTFGIQMLKEGKYSTGEIDNQWTDKIKEDFLKWLDKNPGKIPMSRAKLDEYMKGRTW